MKTIIRLICIVLLLGVGANRMWGADLDISLDASTNVFELSTTSGNDAESEITKTSGGYTYKLYASSKCYYYQSKALFIGSAGSYITLPSVSGKKLTKVTISNCSGAGVPSIIICPTNSTTAVSGGEAATVSAGGSATWTLTGTTPNTSYRALITNSKNLQMTALALEYTTVTPHTITFNAGGGTCATTSSGSVTEYVLPAASPSAACAALGWEFYGWATASVASATTTAPAIVGIASETYYPTSNVTLYAVYYVPSGYEKVTSTSGITSGAKYLIGGYDYNNDLMYLMGDNYYQDTYYYMEGHVVGIAPEDSYDVADVDLGWRYIITGTENAYVIKDNTNTNYVDVMEENWLSASSSRTYTIDFGTGGRCSIKNNAGSAYLVVFIGGAFGDNGTAWDAMLLYKETGTYMSSPTAVALSKGSLSHADITLPQYVVTHSATAADRRVTIIVDPDDGYDISPAKQLTFTQTTSTAVATYISGPTDNGDGTCSYVYEFAQGNNGAGAFGMTAGHLSFYRTACYREFAGNAAAGDKTVWSNTGNWTGNRLPTIQERADILKPVTVDITDATAKSVVLKQNSGNTGHLEIPAGKELVVATTVRKTTDGSTLVATGVNDIEISSTSALGLGALVMGTHDGTNKATVNFYTRSNGKKETNTSVGQYVGTPFSDETNILYNWYNSWVYGIKYTSNVIGWERVEEGSGMDPFKGYCVFSADAWDSGTGHSYWQQGTLVSSDNHTCSGLNWQSGSGTANLNNENLLANSWMAPIKIKAMQSSDFTNTYATVYIFNSTSNSAYSSLAGNYTAHTVGTSEGVIPAMQSFSVFTTGSGASVSLDYNKIVYAPAVAGTASPAVNSAPSRSGRSADEADKMRLFVRSENGCGDMLYMWERADFTEGFENGWDGHKLYGESYAPQLYAITPDGFMAVNCVPDWEGTVVGFRAGTEDNQYTFSFEYDGEQTWYLNDLKTEQSTRILSGNTYQFSTADEDMEARFIISATPISYVPTAIENGEAGKNVHKLLIDGILYIIRDGRMYDATGVMVR